MRSSLSAAQSGVQPYNVAEVADPCLANRLLFRDKISRYCYDLAYALGLTSVRTVAIKTVDDSRDNARKKIS